MNSQRGFTIVEVLVAVLVLSVGLLALVGTAGMVTRMVGQGHRYTIASALASERVEMLRAQGCPDAGAGSETRGAYTISWRIVDVAAGKGRRFFVSVQSPTPRGQRTDNVETVHFCS
jgi:type IV pilus modification protein PilV